MTSCGDDSAHLETWAEALEGIVSQPGETTVAASEILPWLFLGGKPAAEDAVHGNALAVTHVLNCCEPWCTDGPNFSKLRYVGFEAYDEPGYPLLTLHYADVAKPLLEEARTGNGRCLVHCAMGVNRSAAIVVAYLIDAMAMDLLAAVELVKNARGCVLGNTGFRADLVSFAAERGQLANVPLRDEWRSRRPPPPEPDPLVFGAPPEAWRSLPITSGTRVRIHICGEEWAEGVASIDDDMCVVALDDGTTDSVPVNSPDVCAVPV